MIRIRELYRLQNLKALRLIAGQEGLERTVTEAVLFEYDPSRMQLPDFYRGDLVLTTLAYARGDAQLVSQSLIALMNQGIAGLLVKTAYFSFLPQDVIERANHLHTPIFLFDETYIEEVVLEVTQLIRGRRHFGGYEKEIDALMRGDLTGDQAKEKAARIDPVHRGAYCIFALNPAVRLAGMDERLYAALSEDADAAQRCICMEWRRMILVLWRGGAQEEEMDALLKRAGLARGELCVGCSRVYEDLTGMGAALSEAIYAARAAKLQKKPFLHAKGLGLYGWLFPMSENAFVCEQCRRSLAVIREYDAQNRTSLEQTARVYVQSRMEIAAAAKALFQHPNTVRYRLAKVQQLMGMENDAEFLPMLSMMIHLSSIMEEGQ